MIGLLIMGAMMIAYFFVVTIAMFFALTMAMVLHKAPGWMQVGAAIIFAVVVAAAFAFSFLLMYGRIVYVPQILMVEGKGVFSSIGRSFSLASGQLRRIAALILFWIYVGWSVLLLLFLPLGYISDWVNPFGAEQSSWYNIALQTVTQLSEILLMPIFMIGCTLLYLDSRVRKEGFDVELVANRTLAQPPAPPPLYTSAPEWAAPEWTPAPGERGPFAHSILGLDDYIPAPINPTQAQDEQFAPGGARKICDWCGAETNVENRFCSICGSAFGDWSGTGSAGDPNPDHQSSTESFSGLSVDQRYGTESVSDLISDRETS
jgi:hypothetical protein